MKNNNIFLNKNAYFQGTEEPTPKKKKYKSDKAIVVQPRFKEPFYRNYDLYETEGVDGDPKLGPGAGWNTILQYKSISDFLKEKRKKLKNKYKAEDDWITDENHDERVKRMKTRAKILSKIIKIAIDFPIDEQIESDPIITDSESYDSPTELGPTGNPNNAIFPTEANPGTFESYPASAQIGGILDKYLPLNDFEGKSPDQLDFGRDYVEDEKPIDLEKIKEKYDSIPIPNHGLYGLPDGVDLPQDEEPISTNINPYYGTTDLGIDIYKEIF